jgi:acetyl-CoA C-acetyltransferase
MTKHVYGVYSTAPGPLAPPDEPEVQRTLDAIPAVPVAAEHDGDATVAAYSVVHGRDGAPESAVLVCDIGDTGGARAYARLDDPERVAASEVHELVGSRVALTPTTVAGPMGDARVNLAGR